MNFVFENFEIYENLEKISKMTSEYITKGLPK